jgi:hypothetical protein
MESNLMKSFLCNQTLNELAAMAIGSETSFHPFLCYTRTGDHNLKVNMLDEADWMLKVKQFISSVIVNPNIILDSW